MTERPILFSAPMVRAILDGRKTQTRRVVKPVRGYEHNNVCRPDMAAEDYEVWWHGESDRVGCLQSCPFGIPGDSLWVRETFHAFPDGRIRYRCDPLFGFSGTFDEPWTPSIFMPRSASRITLHITGVRVERLQGISQVDAMAEGIERVGGEMSCSPWRNYRKGEPGEMDMHCSYPPRSFMTLWESINGAGSWDANPWVWVIEFRAAGGE